MSEKIIITGNIFDGIDAAGVAMSDEYVREITITATCPDGTSESVYAEVTVAKADPLRAAEAVRDAASRNLGQEVFRKVSADQ